MLVVREKKNLCHIEHSLTNSSPIYFVLDGKVNVRFSFLTKLQTAEDFKVMKRKHKESIKNIVFLMELKKKN